MVWNEVCSVIRVDLEGGLVLGRIRNGGFGGWMLCCLI